MIELNDNSIFIGQIKQLLKDFNLPKCLVGEENATLGNHYIANNSIYFFEPGTSGDAKKGIPQTFATKKRICPYVFGKAYSGLTTNLQIRNLIYDTYTHRYLGDYLRFIRDYKHIDLMSMYNCFDEEVNERNVNKSIQKEFDGIKNGFITYSVPIKLNQKYTLNVQTHTAIETCLTFHKLERWTDLRRPNTSSTDATTNQSYTIPAIINSLGKVSFNKYLPKSRILIDPFKWTIDAPSETTLGNELPSPKYLADIIKTYNYELRLLIKIPMNLKSSVSLLEGDYTRTYNLNEEMPSYFRFTDTESDQDKFHGPIPGTFIYNPQLFNLIGTKNYLLADRLEEYLVGNPISPLSEDYDVLKVQNYLTRVKCDGVNNYLNSDSYGTWSEKDTNTIRSYFIMDNNSKLGLEKYDLIGYVDKVIEEKMIAEDKSQGDYLV